MANNQRWTALVLALLVTSCTSGRPITPGSSQQASAVTASTPIRSNRWATIQQPPVPPAGPIIQPRAVTNTPGPVRPYSVVVNPSASYGEVRFSLPLPIWYTVKSATGSNSISVRGPGMKLITYHPLPDLNSLTGMVAVPKPPLGKPPTR